MEIHVSSEPIESLDADWVVAGVFEDSEPPFLEGTLGELLRDTIADLRKTADFEGKPNELLPLYTVHGVNARRVLLVGLGKQAEATSRTFLNAASAATRRIAKKARGRIAFDLFGGNSSAVSLDERATMIACGAIVASVGCDLYRNDKNVHSPRETVVCLPPSQKDVAGRAVSKGRILGQAINLARELVNLPPAELGPEEFCQHANLVARECELDLDIFGPEKLAELGMNCILGVGQGSARPPRLLVLRYHDAKSPTNKTLCLVGKGITFDSGGLSLKTADGMSDMKCDMAGAATVLAATGAIAQQQLPINLVTIIPLAENMPSGTAIRPGDVLRAKNGKTIEVVNTDAEGRLVLADALCHAVDLGATHIVDLATLTGACVVALGTKVGGVMTNNKSWGDQVLAAAEQTGEFAWPLPMFSEYDEPIRSKIADMKNSGGRWGGAITAAKLLQRFVADTPWTHVDIAGPAFAESDSAIQDAGGTGYFVRSLIKLAENYG